MSKWPGRNQTIQKTGVTYYIDNAHTKDSVALCKNWFEERASKEAKMITGVIKKVLIFNLGGDRDGYTILQPLVVSIRLISLYCASFKSHCCNWAQEIANVGYFSPNL